MYCQTGGQVPPDLAQRHEGRVRRVAGVAQDARPARGQGEV